MNTQVQTKQTGQELQHSAPVEKDGKLVIRCQSHGDKAELTKLVPHDRRGHFVATWSDDGNSLVFEPFVVHPATATAPAPAFVMPPADQADERARLMGMKVEELKTLAGEKSVPWDTKASKATMVDRLLEAMAKKPPAPPA